MFAVVAWAGPGLGRWGAGADADGGLHTALSGGERTCWSLVFIHECWLIGDFRFSCIVTRMLQSYQIALDWREGVSFSTLDLGRKQNFVAVSI